MWPIPQQIAELVTFSEEILKTFVHCIYRTKVATLKWIHIGNYYFNYVGYTSHP